MEPAKKPFNGLKRRCSPTRRNPCNDILAAESKVRSCAIFILLIWLILKYSYFFSPRQDQTQDGKRDQHDASAVFDPATTLVTAFYPLGDKAKVPVEDYYKWMSSFFGEVQAPIVAYVPSDVVAHDIQTMRGNLSIIIKVVDLWNLPPAKKYKKAFQGVQHDLDPEKEKHSPELYAVWNSKTWMLNHVAHENPFGSKYFFWVDAGAWRWPVVSGSGWPDSERVRAMWEDDSRTDRLVLSSAMIKEGRLCVQGGFFGGFVDAIVRWSEDFYLTLEKHMQGGLFVGKDQDLMTDILYAQPGKYLIIRADQSAHGDPWYFFEPFLANPKELNSDADVSSVHHKRFLELGEVAAHAIEE